jgi:hypothetical protein
MSATRESRALFLRSGGESRSGESLRSRAVVEHLSLPKVGLSHRSSRAHGFAPSVVHFPVKSAYLCQKLSDRMSEGGRAKGVCDA